MRRTSGLAAVPASNGIALSSLPLALPGRRARRIGRHLAVVSITSSNGLAAGTRPARFVRVALEIDATSAQRLVPRLSGPPEKAKADVEAVRPWQDARRAQPVLTARPRIEIGKEKSSKMVTSSLADVVTRPSI